MDGEEDGKAGAQEETGVEKAEGALADGGSGFEEAIAERDEQIAALQAQIAEAAKSAEKADELSKQIEDLRAEQAAEREEFALKMAGARSVAAARALLGDHKGDVEALKEAEPWLFAEAAPKPQEGKTGLEPKGAAVSADKQMKRWREIAGLED